MAKQVIHINQHTLKKNRLTGQRKPAVTFKRKSGGPATLAHQVAVVDEKGREVCRVVCNMDKPLACGAVAYVETKLTLIPLTREGNPCRGQKARPARPKICNNKQAG